MYTIENERLRVSVKSMGCELAGIYDLRTGEEYLWQGDESIWYGQSPILFPIIGRLVNDEYSLDGKTYSMPKHGIARKTEWQLAGKTADSISFELTESEKTLETYPYAFRLRVTFTLRGASLAVTHEVVNRNDRVMYFSLGAHPAFNCEIGDRLVFEQPENLRVMKIDKDSALLLGKTFPMPDGDREIVVTEHVFDDDALILKGVRSRTVALMHGDRRRLVFHIGGSPYLGVWAKPGAPYVCIEPWFGVNDPEEGATDFSRKEGINALGPGDTFTFTWSADFDV